MMLFILLFIKHKHHKLLILYKDKPQEVIDFKYYLTHCRYHQHPLSCGYIIK